MILYIYVDQTNFLLCLNFIKNKPKLKEKMQNENPNISK